MSSICKDCGHRHRGIAECKFCDCVWETVTLDDKWVKAVKAWFKKLLFYRRIDYSFCIDSSFLTARIHT